MQKATNVHHAIKPQQWEGTGDGHTEPEAWTASASMLAPHSEGWW